MAVHLASSEVSSWQALKQVAHYMMELVGVVGSLSHRSFVGVVVRLAFSEVSSWQALKQASHYNDGAGGLWFTLPPLLCWSGGLSCF